MNFYTSSEYLSYNHLVEAHDNYVILSSANKIDGASGDPASVNAIYLYLNPHVEIPFKYTSEESFNFPSVSTSSDIKDSPIFPSIFICSFILIYLFIFLINQLTKLVKKGGVFGYN